MESYSYVKIPTYLSGCDPSPELILESSGFARIDRRSEWLRYLKDCYSKDSSWSFLNDTESVLRRVRECPCPSLAVWRLDSIMAVVSYNPGDCMVDETYERYKEVRDCYEELALSGNPIW